MRIESTHGNESGPARRMRQQGVLATQQRDLGGAQRQNRVAFGQQRAMKSEEEAAADGIVYVPEAGHDVRHARREEGPAEAQGALDP